ncbi:hypothetical protein ACMD2_04895 [Ananas comosus]|uniref:Uncharacterized protein n=1 Tax=Ananas comosus TaxID=4615 RepID=A0A199UML2_ANACO|nr:hypothetical protein ACMD2_04895 [Ananas comosus]
MSDFATHSPHTLPHAFDVIAHSRFPSLLTILHAWIASAGLNCTSRAKTSKELHCSRDQIIRRASELIKQSRKKRQHVVQCQRSISDTVTSTRSLASSLHARGDPHGSTKGCSIPYLPPHTNPHVLSIRARTSASRVLLLRRGSHGHVVGDVGAGAVAGEEEAAEVAARGEPGLGAGGGVGRGPFERGPGVVVGGGERVLGGEAVVDGDGDDPGRGGEGGEVAVVLRGEGRLDAEGAAVEVDDDRELRRRRRLAGGEVEPRGDAAVGVDGDVLGEDAHGGIGVGVGADESGAVEALDAAALVEAEEGGEVELELGVGIHGDRRCGGGER